MDMYDIMDWWRTLLYSRGYAFTQKENLVKFVSMFEIYRFRFGEVANKMREL
jgi:hypothetical protein